MAILTTQEEINLRELLNKLKSIKAEKGTRTVTKVGDATWTRFYLPYGYKPVAVYVAGLRKMEGTYDRNPSGWGDYSVSEDWAGVRSVNGYVIEFAVAPALNADVIIDLVQVSEL